MLVFVWRKKLAFELPKPKELFVSFLCVLLDICEIFHIHSGQIATLPNPIVSCKRIMQISWRYINSLSGCCWDLSNAAAPGTLELLLKNGL